MNLYVLDASVAAKCVLPPADEPLVSEAMELLDAYVEGRVRLVVPDVFWPEIGNVLWKAVRFGRMSRQNAGDALQTFRERRIPTSPSQPLMEQAFSIAVAFDRAIYDCMYIALAIVSRSQLVTADRRLANSLGAQFPVRWLGAWNL